MRVWLLRAVVAMLFLNLGAPIAVAQVALPKSIRIVVPFPAGGSNDVIARALAASLSKRLQLSVLVDNKAGAAGVIGSDAVAKGPDDGSVLLLTSSSFLTAAATQPQLPYDPLNAFVPVAVVGQGPMVLAVSSESRIDTPAALVAAARAKPGALNYGTAGVGSIAHLATELLDDTASIRMTHVAYKGAANAATDLAGGRIQVMISNYSSLAPLLKTGTIKLIAVTSGKPHPAFPDLPSLATVAPGFEAEIWVAVFAPAKTPSALVARLNQEINAIAASPDLAPVLEPDGTLPQATSPAAAATRLKDELARWKKIATDHHIVAE